MEFLLMKHPPSEPETPYFVPKKMFLFQYLNLLRDLLVSGDLQKNETKPSKTVVLNLPNAATL